MAQFWQRQQIYAQVTALGPLGGRWRSHHVRPSITPDSPAKLRQTIPRFTRQRQELEAQDLSNCDGRQPEGPLWPPFIEELTDRIAQVDLLLNRLVPLTGKPLLLFCEACDEPADFICELRLPSA